jgi:DUF971 family protein
MSNAPPATPWPEELRLSRDRRILTISFDDGARFALDAEYLRVMSPSAEARGHGGEEMPPVAGKRDVTITDIEAVGNYAARLHFSDGHDTGLYSWAYLYELGRDHAARWAAYLAALEKGGFARD